MAADTNSLSARAARRLVTRLERYAVLEPVALRNVLRDLPDADVDVLRGVLRITKERTKANGSNRSAVV